MFEAVGFVLFWLIAIGLAFAVLVAAVWLIPVALLVVIVFALSHQATPDPAPVLTPLPTQERMYAPVTMQEREAKAWCQAALEASPVAPHQMPGAYRHCWTVRMARP
jgi:fatty acid desaturase